MRSVKRVCAAEQFEPFGAAGKRRLVELDAGTEIVAKVPCQQNEAVFCGETAENPHSGIGVEHANIEHAMLIRRDPCQLRGRLLGVRIKSELHILAPDEEIERRRGFGTECDELFVALIGAMNELPHIFTDVNIPVDGMALEPGRHLVQPTALAQHVELATG